MLNNRIVTIFGGSGFVGRAIIREVAKLGYTIRVATRNPAACYELRTYGGVGQVVPQFYDPAKPDSIAATINGSYAVINCVGILYERGKSKFHGAQGELPRQISGACRKYGVERFVHISALGVDIARSKYAQTKMAGERAVHDVFPNATILRPSVIFGPEDHFFNLFAWLSQFTPGMPLIGGGKTKFQPVYVGDVARAVAVILQRPLVGGDDPRGKTYELGGPEVLTFREVYERLFAVTGQRRVLVTVPWGVARLQAWFLQFLPQPLLTPDQVISLKTDSVVSSRALTFGDLGVVSTTLDVVLPTYLSRYRPDGPPVEKKVA